MGNHYVKWNYRNYEDTGEPCSPENCEDVNAEPPMLTYSQKRGKYRFEFCGADCGGHDVQQFVWYYDSILDVLTDMMEGVN